MNLMPRSSGARLTRTTIFFSLTAVLVQMLLLFPLSAIAQQDVQWNAQEKPIFDQIKTLRSLPDDVRARTTKDIAVEIRALPATPRISSAWRSIWPAARPRATSATTRCRK